MRLTELKGIGEKTEALFQKLGIHAVEDLLYYFPHSFLSYEKPVLIREAREGEMTAIQGILDRDAVLVRVNGMQLTQVTVRDLSGKMQLHWFHAPFLKATLKAGSVYVFYGKARAYRGKVTLTQPKIFTREEYEKKMGRLEPVYGQTKGLGNAVIQKAVQQAFARLAPREEESGREGAVPGNLPEDFIPASLRYNRKLLPMRQALYQVHFPKDGDEFQAARNRLSYNELLLFSTALLQKKRNTEDYESAFRIEGRPETDRLLKALPFSLTEGQKRAIGEIRGDMASGYGMNRLLQGDVGSGKTIIAITAMLDTALSGYQAALMAPTELLARQHYEKLQSLLADNGLSLSAVLLTGGMSAKEKREAYARIETGEVQLIIGTHALFQEKVRYRGLALVVTDEQHRFGVLQRRELQEKGQRPHVLVMSATPIPRTLALLLYIDMQVSRVTELPSNRLPIKNAVITEEGRQKAYKFLYDEIKKGRQAYLICPMVEKNDSLELKNIEEEVPGLRKIFPKEVRIAGLHGKMKPKEKERTMTAFLHHEIDLLVSTTVVEVGVDVPNSTVMLIENAERFGLAQLHQLRGRVGRSGHQSYCIFLDAKNSKASRERLGILGKSNDGFYIAEEDLRLRGPGDIFGLRQSGEMLFQIADIYQDKRLLEEAAEDAKYLLSVDPALSREEHAAFRRRLAQFIEENTVI